MSTPPEPLRLAAMCDAEQKATVRRDVLMHDVAVELRRLCAENEKLKHSLEITSLHIDLVIRGLSRDAELGRVAMRFVDRAGDVHPGIDDAETICAEFHEAMSSALEKYLSPEMKGKT